MFKYILSIIVIAASLIGAEPSTDSTLNTATVNVSQIRQSISTSIAAIIDDLELGIVTLDDANVMVVKDHLYAVDTEAENLVTKILALFKIKQTEILDFDLAKKLIITYHRFHKKLLQVLPQKHDCDTTVNQQATVDQPNVDCVTK